MGFDDHILTARVELDRAGAGLLDRVDISPTLVAGLWWHG